VQADELPPVQRDDGTVGYGGELQNRFVRNSLVGLTRLERGQYVVFRRRRASTP
jgi:hypothetical protein